MTSIAEKVRRAAEYVDRVGLLKHDFNEGEVTNSEAVAAGLRCCTLGAFYGHLSDESIDVQDRLGTRLGVYLAETHPRLPREDWDGDRPWSSVSEWNDRTSRRKKDVVDLLRGFADHLDAQSE